jgi:hypothetical protein
MEELHQREFPGMVLYYSRRPGERYMNLPHIINFSQQCMNLQLPQNKNILVSKQMSWHLKINLFISLFTFFFQYYSTVSLAILLKVTKCYAFP